jgi:hypothetical protein
MAANNILPFGATASNELTQAAYAAEAQRLTGNQPGKASSKLVNKVLHQTNLIASGVAQFLADRQSTDVVDTLTPANIATMLAAVLNGPNLLTTPPQFDNDASPATTQFVQRALGSYSGVYTYSAVQNVTIAQAGGYIKFNLSIAGNVALPNDAPAGTKFTITNANSSLVSINVTTSPGVFGSISSNASGTYAMQPGTESEFVSFGPGQGYDIINGAGQAVLSANGYQKLASGLIVQMFTGNGSSNPAAPFLSRVFPIAFPNQCVALVGSCDNGAPYLFSYNIKTVNGANIGTFNLSGATSNAAYTAIAIGY